MPKAIVVALFTVLLLVVAFLVGWRWIRSGGPDDSDGIASIQFQPGDIAVVTADFVDLHDGDTKVTRLGKECRLSVQQVSGSRVTGTVESGGKTLAGWVDARYLKLWEGDPAPEPTADFELPEAALTAPRTPAQVASVDPPGKKEVNAEATSAPAAAVERPTGELSSRDTPTPPAAVEPPALEVKRSPPPKPAASRDAKLNASEPRKRTTSASREVRSKPVPPKPSLFEPSLGGRVTVARDPSDLDDLQALETIERLVITGEQFTSGMLRKLAGLRIPSLSVEAVNVGNSGLQHVGRVEGLRELRLWTSGVTDAGLEFVARLNELEWLDLEGTAVRGAGLARLRDLPRLSHLILGPMTSDRDLAAVEQLPHLTELDLRACYQLTGACLSTLAKVPTLHVVWLPRQIPAGEDAQLRQALPDCEIRR